MNRKERLKRNLGGTVAATIEPFFKGPALAEARTSIVLPERLVLAVLRSEIDRLKGDRTELERYFSHFFDPTGGTEARDQFVAHFMSTPPTVVLGYPRTTAEFPCFSVVLESDEEVDPHILSHYVGTTLEDEVAKEDAEYEGAFFQQQFGIYVYAEHPNACAYLYQFAKLALFGSKDAFESAGLIDIHYSGGELAPEDYLPENMFARALRMQCKVMMTVPKLFSFKDSRKLRVAGIFRDDVVVDGVRGSVGTYEVNGDEQEG